MLTMAFKFSALDVFFEMDGRQNRHTKEVLDWHREEDDGDLRKSELNESVEGMTCLNLFEGKSEKKIPEHRDE